jgi:hypothetical protein
VDLVDEEDVMLLEVRQDGGEVAGAFDRGTGGDADGDAHLGGDDVSEGGLAKAGRAVEEQVVERFAALLGGVDGDAEVVLELLLADELVEAPGAKCGFQRLVFVLDFAGSDALLGGRQLCLPRMLVLVAG